MVKLKLVHLTATLRKNHLDGDNKRTLINSHRKTKSKKSSWWKRKNYNKKTKKKGKKRKKKLSRNETGSKQAFLFFKVNDTNNNNVKSEMKMNKEAWLTSFTHCLKKILFFMTFHSKQVFSKKTLRYFEKGHFKHKLNNFFWSFYFSHYGGLVCGVDTW